MTDNAPHATEVHIGRLIALAGFARHAHSAQFARSMVGAASGPKRGEGGDIYDLRPFQEGDDPRQIDPGASARSARPQVRNRHEQVDRTALLLADYRSCMFWSTRGRLRSVAAAEALAVEGWQVVAGGGQVGCAVTQDDAFEHLPPKPRETAMLGVARSLSRLHTLAFQKALARKSQKAPPPPPDLDVMLDRACNLARPGCDLVLATGFDSPGAHFEAIAHRVMRKCNLMVLLIQDALETDPPAGVFSAKLGGRLIRGRMQPSPSKEELERYGINVRVIPAAQAIDAEMVH